MRRDGETSGRQRRRSFPPFLLHSSQPPLHCLTSPLSSPSFSFLMSKVDHEPSKRPRLDSQSSLSASVDSSSVSHSSPSLPIPVPRRVPFYVPLESIASPDPVASPLPEWVLLDLQGELQFKSLSLLSAPNDQFSPDSAASSAASPTDPLEFGTLWKESDGRILLRIGTSICEAKLVKLPKPYLVAQKLRIKGNQTSQNGSDRVDNPPDSVSIESMDDTGAPGLRCCAVVRQKLVFAQRPKPIVAQLNRA